MCRSLGVTLACLAFLLLHHHVRAQTKRCVTPDNRDGQCVNIRDCEPLLDLLRKERPPRQETIDFLRKSQCWFEGKTPFVCCPKPVVSTPNKPTLPLPDDEPPTTVQRPVDVSGHPAVRLLPQLCGPVSESKITKGDVSELYQFPWMVLLGYNTRNGLQYRCGGSLINDRYVLTAAHCISHLKDIQLVEVRLGEHNVSSEQDCQKGNVNCAPPVQDIAVDRAIAHPQYDVAQLRNDIGLIRLRQPAKMSLAVRPVCLPIGLEQQEKSLEGEKVVVTGWGATEFGTASPVLLHVVLPVVPVPRCAAIYVKSVPVTDRQLCAGGEDGKDSCSGDSGGPLQFVGTPFKGGLAYIQYGVVSFGPRHCGTNNRPGVYTRVGHYMEWILDTIRKN